MKTSLLTLSIILVNFCLAQNIELEKINGINGITLKSHFNSINNIKGTLVENMKDYTPKFGHIINYEFIPKNHYTLYIFSQKFDRILLSFNSENKLVEIFFYKNYHYHMDDMETFQSLLDFDLNLTKDYISVLGKPHDVERDGSNRHVGVKWFSGTSELNIFHELSTYEKDEKGFINNYVMVHCQVKE